MLLAFARSKGLKGLLGKGRRRRGGGGSKGTGGGAPKGRGAGLEGACLGEDLREWGILIIFVVENMDAD